VNKLTLFGKSSGCSLCEGWKRKLTALKIPFTFVDILTEDGLAEMAWNNIGRIPALLIDDQRFEEVSPAEISSEKLLELTKL
jgi:glutaredoxin